MPDEDFKTDTRRSIDLLNKRADTVDTAISAIHTKIEKELKPINARQNMLIGVFSVLAVVATTVAKTVWGIVTGQHTP